MLFIIFVTFIIFELFEDVDELVKFCIVLFNIWVLLSTAFGVYIFYNLIFLLFTCKLFEVDPTFLLSIGVVLLYTVSIVVWGFVELGFGVGMYFLYC